MKTFLLLIGCVAYSLSMASQPATAFEINERLGRGINMGNTFEAPSETAWSNPWKPEYFEQMAELGFQHVRIPICWEHSDRSMPNSPYTITNNFRNRIVEVVDKALEVGLMPIINMHHHAEFMADPDGQKDRFLALWVQIADLFKDYDDNLLFEVMNEPTNALSAELWNIRFAEALAVIRQTNPTRTVLFGVAEFGGLGGVPKMVFPADDYLILSIHYYNPFHFTHQGADWSGDEVNTWLGTKWNDTEAERNTVANEFAQAISIADLNNIPINIGEFGAYSKADMASRARWTTFLSRWFEEKGFSWTYWEFSAGFGIYNPVTKTYYQELVDALLHNLMPEPTAVNATTIYESDFSLNADSWNLSLNGTAAGSLSIDEGSLSLEITNKGTEGWHAQMIRQNIKLEANQNYLLSISGRSPSERSATVYLGRDSDPWNAYSDFYSPLFSSSKKIFSYSFKMGSVSDPAARIAFDLGNENGEIILSSVKLEKISVASVCSHSNSVYIKIWPNPTSDNLYFSGDKLIENIEIFDLYGRLYSNIEINKQESHLSVNGIPPGFYFFKFNLENYISQTHKVSIL